VLLATTVELFCANAVLYVITRKKISCLCVMLNLAKETV